MKIANENFHKSLIAVVGIMFLIGFGLTFSGEGMTRVTGMASDDPSSVYHINDFSDDTKFYRGGEGFYYGVQGSKVFVSEDFSPYFEEKNYLSANTIESDPTNFQPLNQRPTLTGTSSPEKINRLADPSWASHLEAGTAFGSGFWMLMSEETRASYMDSFLVQFAENLNARYWISETCMGMYNVDTDSGGGNFVSNLGGIPMVFITIKAQRTEMTHPNETNTSAPLVSEYFYKMEYWASYPEDAYINSDGKMEFHIVLYSGGHRMGRLTENAIKVDDGDTKSATGSNMIRKESKVYYDEVCLEFLESIRDFDGSEKSAFCEPIVSYSGGATGFGGGSGSGGASSGSGTF